MKNEILDLLEKSIGKKIIFTHIGDPDGMFSAVELCKVLDLSDIQVIPIDHMVLKDEVVSGILKKTDALAVIDIPPIGRSIKYYCDHHLSSKEQVEEYVLHGKIAHCYYDPKAPSAFSMVVKLAKILFNKTVDEKRAAIIDRCDTAGYKTDAPVSYGGFKSGDEAWQYDYLVRSSNDGPLEFIELFNKLMEKDVHSLLPEYDPKIKEIIKKNAKVEEFASNIKTDTLTIVVGKDDEIVNRGLMFRIYKRSRCKVSVTIAPKEKGLLKIGFGTDPVIGDDELDLYRVDTIARSFGGGGHPRASGCHIKESELDDAIEKIKVHFSSLSCVVVKE